MGREDFDKFVDEQVKQANVPQFDRKKALEEWITAINQFFTKVDSFLEPYVSNDKIQIEQKSKPMFEDLFGNYQAKTYDVHVGAKSIRLEPIARFVVGAMGRIDMIGLRKSVVFLLVPKNVSAPKITVVTSTGKPVEPPPLPPPPQLSDQVWKIAVKAPRIQFFELDQDSFLNAIMEVVNG